MYGKGVDILIRAIPHILQKTEKPENLKFVVVGPTSQSFDPDLRSSYYDFLNRLVDELKLKRYVIFAGLLSEVDLRNLYSRSYIFVLPSRGEAEPLVLLEAMSSGLPLIGSNVGGIPEIIEEGRIGTVLNSNCSDELAVSILRLLPEQVQSVFSANSREVAVNTYDWKIISKKVINIYIDAIMS
jgi:glycosyltransferase involved in cell wall biosynthesis